MQCAKIVMLTNKWFLVVNVFIFVLLHAKMNYIFRTIKTFIIKQRQKYIETVQAANIYYKLSHMRCVYTLHTTNSHSILSVWFAFFYLLACDFFYFFFIYYVIFTFIGCEQTKFRANSSFYLYWVHEKVFFPFIENNLIKMRVATMK